MSLIIEVAPGAWENPSYCCFRNVIGHVVAAVIKNDDGSITLERAIGVKADTKEDNDLAESVVKTIERKLNEAFPDPNKQQEEPKLWVPE